MSGPVRLYDATYQRFQAVVSVDAINHLPDRAGVLRDWHRLLAPGGRALFTDPVVVTGLLSSQEIAWRASIGDFVFALRGEDERLLREAGFALVRCQDTTAGVARVARRWHDARARHRPELLEDEGEETFTGTQRFLATVAALAEQRRLSRYTFLTRRAHHQDHGIPDGDQGGRRGDAHASLARKEATPC